MVNYMIFLRLTNLVILQSELIYATLLPMNINPIFIVICTQILFSTSDILARYNMKGAEFSVTSFFSTWFVVYFLIRQIAMFGQLYVFANIELGKTAALFAMSSILIANIIGLVFLKEVLSTKEYIGISIALIAFLVLATR